MSKKSTKEEKKSAEKVVNFGSAIAQICEEKGIAKKKVLETIEAALAAAYKKDYGKKGQNIRSEFDEVSGNAKFYLVKEVVDESTREFVEEISEEEKVEKKLKPKNKILKETEEEKLPRFNIERDLTLKEAQKIKPKAQVGDIIEISLKEKKDYGRVAAQTAKQVIIQRIREAERDAMYDEYKNKEGELIAGVVQRIEGRNVFIDIGKSIGILFPSEQIERENYRVGQRMKVYVIKVDAGTKGPGITLSRTQPEMVRRLFELEVPEIFAETVEIKSVAREAGERTKIAVFSSEEGVDPIGSCVGQKGTRVQSIIDELGGEKIDIILWNENPTEFISAALSPAKVLKVELKEKEKEAIAIVPEDQLSLAIGKRGQNVRLAAKLTGWKIDIAGPEPEISEMLEKDQEEEGKTKEDKEDKEEKSATLATETKKETEDQAEIEKEKTPTKAITKKKKKSSQKSVKEEEK